MWWLMACAAKICKLARAGAVMTVPALVGPFWSDDGAVSRLTQKTPFRLELIPDETTSR